MGFRQSAASAAKYMGMQDILKSARYFTSAAFVGMGSQATRMQKFGLADRMMGFAGKVVPNRVRSQMSFNSPMYHASRGMRSMSRGFLGIGRSMPWQQRAARYGMMGGAGLMGGYGAYKSTFGRRRY